MDFSKEDKPLLSWEKFTKKRTKIKRRGDWRVGLLLTGQVNFGIIGSNEGRHSNLRMRRRFLMGATCRNYTS